VPSEKRARQRAAREERLAAEAASKKRRVRIRNGIIVLVVAGAIVGITFAVSSGNKTVGSQSSTSTTSSNLSAKAKTNARLQADANKAAVKAGCPASPKTAANHQTYASAPAMTIDTTKSYSATVKTTAGTFTIALNAQAAPKTVNNFVFLAQKGYYNCNSFFRVIPGFVNQTGNPAQTNAAGGATYTLPAENLPPAGTSAKPAYPVGSVAMATSSAGVSGSQFFVVAGPQGESLSSTYPLFGLVSSGSDVIQTINQQGSASGTPPAVTQRILSVTIKES
jgi:cyclophilin family peptidyl-prolyl cis-trans isomerase